MPKSITNMNSREISKTSEDLLLDVKMEKYSSQYRLQLKEVDPALLNKSLSTDDKKKAFWLNIYNAYYQILRMEGNVVKPDIYKEKLFSIAGTKLSLDNVEHGILRKCKYKYSLGYLPNLWTSKFVRNNAVKELDYRIHFALNCGAKSCPPIAFYNSEKINTQLNLATLSFLEGESEFDDAQKIVKTTALFKWFLADFGGIKGIKKIFAKHLNKDVSDYRIEYKTYSWEDDLANFAD